VLGLGISGRSAAAYCAGHGAAVVAADERPRGDLESLDALPDGVDLRVGEPFPDPAEFDLVVPSPGVPPARYADRAREALCDVELAFRALRVPVVAITGTNGKSTTTLLVEALLRRAGVRARAAGNVGSPALSLVGEALDVAVLEVSSFQLETAPTLRPRVAVILNLAPDHLDRHGTFEAYAAAKARVLTRQEPGDAAVLNFDDPAVRALADRTRAAVWPCARSGPLPRGAWLDAGCVVVRADDAEPVRISLDGFRLQGGHHRDNARAALCAVAALGVDPRAAAPALASFRGLPHRGEIVGRRRGVAFADDSKATNPAAACSALEGAPGPVVWIAGGRDKGLDYTPLAEAAAGRVRAAVLIGEAAGALKDALAGRVPTHCAASIEDAVRAAAALAEPGDTVLLAPACASQDQFRDYAERGERFRAAVAALDGVEELP